MLVKKYEGCKIRMVLKYLTLDDLHLPIDVDVAVLALNAAIGEPGLQLERSVRRLVAVCVGPVIVQPGRYNVNSRYNEFLIFIIIIISEWGHRESAKCMRANMTGLCNCTL